MKQSWIKYKLYAWYTDRNGCFQSWKPNIMPFKYFQNNNSCCGNDITFSAA